MSHKLLTILPSNGHGGCEYNALSALKYFRDRHGLHVVASFPQVPETDYLNQLCDLNDIAVEPLSCTFELNDTQQRTEIQRHAAWQVLDTVAPDAVFIAMPWPKRGQGLIAGCADCGVPTLVKFALVPPAVENADFVLPDSRRAIGKRQVWFANSRYSARLIEKHWSLPPNSVDSFHVGPIGLAHLLPQASALQTREAARHSVCKEFGLPAHCRIAMTVGRLAPQKGYETLMAAVPTIRNAHPDTVFLWAGHGELQESMSGWITANDLGDVVKLAGFRDDVRRLLRASDLFILPTVYEGGCSQALLEAMEEGLPIVVSDASAVSEVIRHEHNGLLVPPRDDDALATAVLRLLRNAPLRQELAANAKRDADAFSAERSFEHTFLRLRRALSSTGLTAGKPIHPSPFMQQISSRTDITIKPDDPGFGRGWYETERCPHGRTFRWMAYEAVVATQIVVDRPTVVELAGYSTLTRDALDHLELFVNGAKLPRADAWRDERNHDWVCSWRINPQPGTRRGIEIRLASAHAARPCALDPGSSDTRALSVAISALTFRVVA